MLDALGLGKHFIVGDTAAAIHGAGCMGDCRFERRCMGRGSPQCNARPDKTLDELTATNGAVQKRIDQLCPRHAIPRFCR